MGSDARRSTTIRGWGYNLWYCRKSILLPTVSREVVNKGRFRFNAWLLLFQPIET